MARSFKDAIRQRRDPLLDVDETVPGFIPDPSTYSQPTPGGTRRARTFSQTIADATRGVDAGMNRFTPQKPDLSSSAYKPDWRGHYNGADAKPVPRIFLDLATRKRAAPVLSPTLYGHRNLLNAQQLHDWASDAGIPNLVPPEEMHVTTIYSRQPVDIAPRTDHVIAKRRIEPLGDKGALVLHFDSPELQAQHAEAMAAGASHDWPSYQTHVTLSYDTGGQDFSGLEAPKFPLTFGPEIHAPINDGWAEDNGLRKGAFGMPHPPPRR